MLISYNWIKSFTSFKDKLSPFEIRNLFSWHSCEIDEVISESEAFDFMVAGHIKEIKKHENADSLSVCQVDLGEIGTHQIVCGGDNLKKDQIVAVAMPKAKVRWHGEGDLIELSKTKIRGEESFGMICAAEEIGMGKSKDKNILDISHTKAKAGTPLSEVFKKNDFILDIDNKTLTNRPDLWSAEGLARELATITKTKFTALNPKAEIPTTGEQVNLIDESKDFIHRFQTLIIENLEVKESPKEIQELLIKSGVNPKNNIVDATNYVMYEIGQPMHAYDFDSVSVNNKVDFTIKKANKLEKLMLLGDQEIELQDFDNVLYVKGKPQILLSIKGGVNSGVNENTKKIVLESAVFDCKQTRKSSTHHHVRTDSSARYEKQLDAHNTQRAIFRCLEILKLSCPDLKVSGPLQDYFPVNNQPKTISLPIHKIEGYMGVKVDTKESIRILESLDFKVTEKETTLEVTPPTFRSTGDINIYQDLIEEIARHYGYHNLESKIKPHTKSGINLKQRELEYEVREHLSNLGMYEVINYNFVSEKDIQNVNLDPKNHLKLFNSLNTEHTHMRQTLLINMLKNCHLNHKNFDSFELFEIGRTNTEIGEFFPAEEEKLGMIVSGHKDNFLILKGYLESLINTLNLKGIKFQKSDDASSYFHPNKTGKYMYQGKNLFAEIGYIHPLTQKNFDLKDQTEIAYAEINLGLLHKHSKDIKKFTEINNLPALEFDLSIIVEEKILNSQIIEIINKSSKDVVNIDFADCYRGANIGENLKSMTYKIKLQSKERTLESKDLESAQQNCYKNLEKIGGFVRGSE